MRLVLSTDHHRTMYLVPSIWKDLQEDPVDYPTDGRDDEEEESSEDDDDKEEDEASEEDEDEEDAH
ncbi:hypothetical protein Tco_0493554, partial [Tanacetum coccineum]